MALVVEGVFSPTGYEEAAPAPNVVEFQFDQYIAGDAIPCTPRNVRLLALTRRLLIATATDEYGEPTTIPNPARHEDFPISPAAPTMFDGPDVFDAYDRAMKEHLALLEARKVRIAGLPNHVPLAPVIGRVVSVGEHYFHLSPLSRRQARHPSYLTEPADHTTHIIPFAGTQTATHYRLQRLRRPLFPIGL